MNEFFDREDGYRRESIHVGQFGLLKNIFVRFKRQIILFFVIVVIFIVIVIKMSAGDSNIPSGDQNNWYKQQLFYHKYASGKKKHVYDISFISDDDKNSRQNPDKLVFTSTLLRGKLRPVYDESATKVTKYNLELLKDLAQNVTTSFNEKGRGAELSDLCNYRNKLLAFDDRTGIVFWYNSDINKMIPYIILIEGNAIDGDKGQKTEWAFVAPGFYNNGKRKERDVLYVGSIGKEWNDPKTGEIVNLNNQWVKIIDIIPPDSKEYGKNEMITDGKGVNDYAETFRIEHVNVRDNLYEVMRKITDATNPGYIVHEAACYNSKYNNWWFLPRRHSREPYNEKADEHAGTDMVFVINSTDPFHATAAQNEANMEVRHLGVYNNTRGWSSCKFLPYQEDHLLAIRTMEVDDVVATYATVIDITTSKILLPETFLGWKKFEGVEFV